MERPALIEKIRRSLRKQGFRVSQAGVFPPENLSKDAVRKLHASAVEHKVEQAGAHLRHKENELLQFVANGSEIDPLSIAPSLVEVRPGSIEELIFRYVTLHWSVPVSAGYGRRLRFLVKDTSNDKVIGLIGLCDPVIALAGRDEWVGWSEHQRWARLRHVMDAFVLGAIPPYSQLLFGKFVALLCGSDEVRKASYQKYHGSKSLIRRKRFDGRIALITTMSALGRSSLYSRLTIDGQKVFQSVGFSKGTGEFHFSNGLYDSISRYANRYCEPTYRQSAWGEGFRNRREVIRKCLKKLRLSVAWSYHGIERECFVVPLASNTQEFLRGEHERLRWRTIPADHIYNWFRSRWLLSRFERDKSYLTFKREDYRLWEH